MRCYLLIFLAAAMMIIACKRKPDARLKDQATIDSIYSVYGVICDSVNHSWESMMVDDDEKHRYMKRLLLEVSYTNLYDKKEFELLGKKIDTLKSMRYDQKTMARSDLIDQYDSATFQLTSEVIQYAIDHPRYDDFPLMEELIDDINSKNDMILIHRIHYDGFAIQLNRFIEQNRDWLERSDKEFNAEPRPLFQLPG